MPFYKSVGDVPRKRHTQFRDSKGNLYAEELMGEEGFSSDSSLLYHMGLPSALVESQEWVLPDSATTPNHPLKPRHLKPHQLFLDADWNLIDVVFGRRQLLANVDVRISYVAAGKASELYRNAIGDECAYIEGGCGAIQTVFGELQVGEGDYVVIPRSTTHRWIPSGDGPLRAYIVEASGHISPPRRYLSGFGQFLEHAPYCERDLRGPESTLLLNDPDASVYVKHRGQPNNVVGSILTYATHPFDVVGWDGCLYPYVFNIRDYEPITGRVHQPPPVHQVFEGPNFVICNFVPRKVDYHPLAVPVPYYHSNVDSDEVMFYVRGDYEARKGSGITAGSISLHPGGHAHGPQPGAAAASLGATAFDELAVMVDTFRPLEIGEGGSNCEDPQYAWTWSGRRSGADS